LVRAMMVTLFLFSGAIPVLIWLRRCFWTAIALVPA
jgi:hypothetical protein